MSTSPIVVHAQDMHTKAGHFMESACYQYYSRWQHTHLPIMSGGNGLEFTLVICSKIPETDFQHNGRTLLKRYTIIILLMHLKKCIRIHVYISLVKSAIPRFCVEVLPKFLNFDYFVLVWWQTDKKPEILKESCKDLFIWTELPIV